MKPSKYAGYLIVLFVFISLVFFACTGCYNKDGFQSPSPDLVAGPIAKVGLDADLPCGYYYNPNSFDKPVYTCEGEIKDTSNKVAGMLSTQPAQPAPPAQPAQPAQPTQSTDSWYTIVLNMINRIFSGL